MNTKNNIQVAMMERVDGG